MNSERTQDYFLNTGIYTQLRNLQRQEPNLRPCEFDCDSLPQCHPQALLFFIALILKQKGNFEAKRKEKTQPKNKNNFKITPQKKQQYFDP